MNDRLQKLIEARGPIRKVGVIGMGYVGIPSAVLFADCPTIDTVYGFQRDSPAWIDTVHQLRPKTNATTTIAIIQTTQRPKVARLVYINGSRTFTPGTT